MNNLEKFDTWKIQLIIAINFNSRNDNDEEHARHTISDNIEIMFKDKEDEIIEDVFQSSISRYQIGLERFLICLRLCLFIILQMP